MTAQYLNNSGHRRPRKSTDIGPIVVRSTRYPTAKLIVRYNDPGGDTPYQLMVHQDDGAIHLVGWTTGRAAKTTQHRNREFPGSFFVPQNRLRGVDELYRILDPYRIAPDTRKPGRGAELVVRLTPDELRFAHQLENDRVASVRPAFPHHSDKALGVETELGLNRAEAHLSAESPNARQTCLEVLDRASGSLGEYGPYLKRLASMFIALRDFESAFRSYDLGMDWDYDSFKHLRYGLMDDRAAAAGLYGAAFVSSASERLQHGEWAGPRSEYSGGTR